MKNILKVFACLLFVSLVIFTTAFSAFALDVTTDSNATLVNPLWELEYIEYTIGDERFVFELPTNFFNTIGQIDNVNTTVLLKGEANYSCPVSFSVGEDAIMMTLTKSYTYDTVSFKFGEVVIPYELITFSGTYTPILISHSDTASTNVKFSFGIPVFTYASDGSVIGRRYNKLGRFSIDNYNTETSIGEEVGNGAFCITPNNNDMSFVASTVPNISLGGFDGKFIHVYEHSATISFPEDNDSSLTIIIPTYSLPSVSFYDYIQSTFPPYTLSTNNDTDGLFSGFGEFITTTLESFLQFEILPGLSIATILMGVIGISLIPILLKFFSGG